MKLRRREAEVFSLSFLDCICCGFGAIILLLVLTEVDQPVVIERAQESMNGQVRRLQEELFVLRGETDQLNRELKGRIAALRTERARLAALQGDLTEVHGEFAASRTNAAATNIIEGELVSAFQELTAEMERLQKAPKPVPVVKTPVVSVGGIPVDSEYVVFVIDTSGSMVENHWQATADIMREALDIYPQVKGMQVINDQGRYMFTSRLGQWLTDSPDLRQRIRNTLPKWTPFSKSNPVPGIEFALRNYRKSGQRISIYVVGDDFAGESMQAAAESIAQLNAEDGKRPRARIHAIGFPEGSNAAFTSVQFSALMRVVTGQNDGTFVGITSEKSCRSYTEILGIRQCIR
jgi:hypothetical protein